MPGPEMPGRVCTAPMYQKRPRKTQDLHCPSVERVSILGSDPLTARLVAAHPSFWSSSVERAESDRRAGQFLLQRLALAGPLSSPILRTSMSKAALRGPASLLFRRPALRASNLTAEVYIGAKEGACQGRGAPRMVRCPVRWPGPFRHQRAGWVSRTAAGESIEFLGAVHSRKGSPLPLSLPLVHL